MQDYRNLAAELVAAFRKQGVDACDVFIVNSSEFNTDVRLGKIEKLEQSISKGLGLRIIKNNATALTYTTDFADKSVKNLVNDSLEIVKVSNADQYNGLAPKEFLGVYDGKLQMFDDSLAGISPARKVEMAKEMEDAGMKFDKRITNTEGSNWYDATRQLTLANSDGFTGQYKSTVASLSVSLLAEENGVKQTDFWYSFNRFANRLDSPRSIGEEAARRVTRKLGGRKVKSQKVPIVLDPLVSRRLVGMVFGAASGRSIYRRSSFLVDKVGAEIASPLVTIVDDATVADGPSSRPFDAEGVRSSRVTVVEKGVLKTFVCDAYAARRLNLKPTGNAARSYQSLPSVGSTNLFMAAGASDPKEMVKSVKNGLYITALFGQGANGVTGDISQGAGGFWIENGEITYPVQEITLAGNALTLLKNITAVGNDLSFKFGGTAAPTILISEATVGGA
ncbi:MAG TPA: TldD/PmbA family protein [Pyrinomonadaceae bacterium]|nr:TldD/PmbA family protein [Pyrinomonadaceae bacterium]